MYLFVERLPPERGFFIFLLLLSSDSETDKSWQSFFLSCTSYKRAILEDNVIYSPTSFRLSTLSLV